MPTNDKLENLLYGSAKQRDDLQNDVFITIV